MKETKAAAYSASDVRMILASMGHGARSAIIVNATPDQRPDVEKELEELGIAFEAESLPNDRLLIVAR